MNSRQRVLSAINPVQTNASEMLPERLKKAFGANVILWGGDAVTRSILNQKSLEEVKNHVRAKIEILSPGGGFVFNTIQNILPDETSENIVTMIAAIDE